MFSFLDDPSQHLSLIYVHFPSLFPLEILRSPGMRAEIPLYVTREAITERSGRGK